MFEELSPNLWGHGLGCLVDFGRAVGLNFKMTALGTGDGIVNGEAVAVGSAFMTVLSYVLGQITEAQLDRILGLRRQCSVSVYAPWLAREFFREFGVGPLDARPPIERLLRARLLVLEQESLYGKTWEALARISKQSTETVPPEVGRELREHGPMKRRSTRAPTPPSASAAAKRGSRAVACAP